jgi:hypothetical protein
MDRPPDPAPATGRAHLRILPPPPEH